VRKIVVGLTVVSICLGWVLPSLLPVNGDADWTQKVALVFDNVKGRSIKLIDQIKK